jgi:hypothetical protein
MSEYLQEPDTLVNKPLDFAKYSEIYDPEAEDTREKLINFILMQADTYKQELDADVSPLTIRHSDFK